jgi:hypothetical protein
MTTKYSRVLSVLCPVLLMAGVLGAQPRGVRTCLRRNARGIAGFFERRSTRRGLWLRGLDPGPDPLG